MTQKPRHPAAACTPAQHAVFEQIAVGNDRCHHPATLAALLRRGLIEKVGERVIGAPPLQVHVPVYEVPLPLHMAWCEWCAVNVVDPL